MINNYKVQFLLVIAGVVGVVPAMAQATGTSVTGTGCFARESNATTDTYTIRTQTPECSLSFTNSSSAEQTATVLIENIDPDFVTVDNYNEDSGLTKTENTLAFTVDVPTTGASVTIAPWHEYGDEWYFVALADPQPRGTVEVNPVFTQLVNHLNVVNPVFYTNSGDLVQGSNNTDTMRDMYQAMLDELENSKAPMYPVAGNHDYRGSLDIYTEYFGSSNFSFDFANTHFTGVSTAVSTGQGGIDTDLLAWMDQDLSNTDRTHKITLFHHAVSLPWWSSASSNYIEETDEDLIANILDTNGVHTTIHGHNHGYDYRYLTGDDVDTIDNGFYQLITGGAGGNNSNSGTPHHFTLMHVTEDTITPLRYEKNDFLTEVEYSTNDGSQSEVTATVENSGDTDLPYLRLKFKLDSTLDEYLVFDDAGNYYDDFYAHTFEDYTVLYFETEALAGTEVEYTVIPATQLHSEVVNTVNYSTRVSYDTFPESTATAIPSFSATLPNGNTVISNIKWYGSDNLYLKKWKEVPNKQKFNTSYTIGSLPVGRLFDVFVNGELYDRLTSDDDGRIQFTYSTNTKERNFKVKLSSTMYLPEIATIPASEGTAHVRRYKASGNNIANWFGGSSTKEGAFRLTRADVNADEEMEYIVSTAKGNTTKVSVYDEDGNKLASEKPYGSSSTAGVITMRGDLTGDGKEELVLARETGKTQIKVLEYNTELEDLQQLASERVLGRTAKLPIAVAVGNVVGNAKAEIIVVSQDDRKPVIKVYRLNNNRLKLVKKRNLPVDEYDSAAVTIGDLTANGKTDIAVTLTGVDGTSETALYRYRLTTSKRLKLKTSTSIDEEFSGQPQLSAADIVGQNQFSLILNSSSSPLVQMYNLSDNNDFELLTEKYPFGSSSTAGVVVLPIDRDKNGKAELVFAEPTEGSEVEVWYYKTKKSKLKHLFSWEAFDSAFSGGISLAQ